MNFTKHQRQIITASAQSGGRLFYQTGRGEAPFSMIRHELWATRAGTWPQKIGEARTLDEYRAMRAAAGVIFDEAKAATTKAEAANA